MYMTRRIRFERRVAGMCERNEFLKSVSPLHHVHQLVRSRNGGASHIRLTTGAAADGSLAARSTIHLICFNCSFILEGAMRRSQFVGGPEYPALVLQN